MKFHLWVRPIRWALFGAVMISTHAYAQQTLMEKPPPQSIPPQPIDEPDVVEPTYLDGFVGIGGGMIQQFTDPEKGTREAVRMEFGRLSKWVSIDGRAAFGEGYTNYGGFLRVAKHWKFEAPSATGISFGLGLGALYSDGPTPPDGQKRQPFVDCIAAPFLRYVWDWGNGLGMGFDIEYELVPRTIYTAASQTDKAANPALDGIDTLRSRVFLGVSLLFEVD